MYSSTSDTKMQLTDILILYSNGSVFIEYIKKW